MTQFNFSPWRYSTVHCVFFTIKINLKTSQFVADSRIVRRKREFINCCWYLNLESEHQPTWFRSILFLKAYFYIFRIWGLTTAKIIAQHAYLENRSSLLKHFWNKYAKWENLTGHSATPPPTFLNKIDRHAGADTMTSAHSSSRDNISMRILNASIGIGLHVYA